MTALAPRVRDALQALKRQGSAKVRGEQRTRYGIVAERAYGVPMAAIQRLARQLGKDHDLANGLWESGWYEARLLAAYVDEPARVTPRQMDRWAREWDNWAVVDTHCFVLFDRTVHAWTRVTRWSGRREEFVRRGAFALLACLALHDKTAPERRFVAALPLIERAAGDSRTFVRKAVAWAEHCRKGFRVLDIEPSHTNSGGNTFTNTAETSSSGAASNACFEVNRTDRLNFTPTIIKKIGIRKP